MIPYGKHFVDEDDIEAVIAVLKSNNLTQGPMIEEFEKNFSNYVGSKYAVAVSSGTAALHLSSLALDVNNTSFALTSPISFVSTANCIKFCGGDIGFVDIDLNTLNISSSKLEEFLQKSDKKVDVILPVHFSGLSADMKKIHELSKLYNFKIIEDAAHALGSSYDNKKKIGSCCYSDITIFSLHPVKSIAAGEGGVITTNSDEIYRKLIRLRSHGINKLDDTFLEFDQAFTGNLKNPWYYEMQDLGYHYRITDIQCALANSQLKKLDNFITERKKLANNYNKIISAYENINIHQDTNKMSSANHLFILNIDFNKYKISRAELMYSLRQSDIITQVHYLPIPYHPYYRKQLSKKYNIFNASRYYQTCLSIPLFYKLSFEQQELIIDKINTLLK